MSGFSNPIANALGQLVRTALKSVNYVAGISGWQITRDGNAEFNNATIRGALELGVSPNPRIFFGSTIPATLNFSVDFTWTRAVLWYWDATSYYWEAIGTYNPGPWPTRARGTYDTVNGIIVHEFNQGPGSGQSNFILYGSSTYSGTFLQWNFRNGFVAIDPTTAQFTAPAVECNASSVLQSWQTLTLMNGWTGTLKYLRVASPPRSTWIVGNITPGTKADGTQIATLPVGVRPASTNQDIFVNAFGGVISTGQPPHCAASTAGALNIYGIGTSTGASVNGFVSQDLA